MRITADWLTDPGAQAVCAMLAGGGHQAWFVGGCVRNAIIGSGGGAVSDIDITTDARPERVMALARAADLRAVPTGVAHGTVTLVAHGRGIEVTTFRRDVATDGRRATVAFAETIAEDAARRDFTMNALYADACGQVADPLGGLADTRARRVRFIGDPAARIAEDYLRILRFFRFFAWYGDPAGGIDPDGLAACAAHQDGIARLSAERIGAEMVKLLSAPDPSPAVASMAATGVLGRVLPGADAGLLPVLAHVEGVGGLPPDPIRRLAALGGADAADRLRLSRAQARALDLLRAGRVGEEPAAELGYRHGAAAALDMLALRAAMAGHPLAPDAGRQVRFGAAQRFPLRAADLMPALSGPDLGARLKLLEDRWIASGFALDRAALLRPD